MINMSLLRNEPAMGVSPTEYNVFSRRLTMYNVSNLLPSPLDSWSPFFFHPVNASRFLSISIPYSHSTSHIRLPIIVFID